MAEHEHDWTWRPTVNEEGWTCLFCGEQPGFRPDLDRALVLTKVENLLQDFNDSDLIYISNGTMGDEIAVGVANRCVREKRYDQRSILRFILTDPNMHPESTFWQERAAEVLAGEPAPC